MAAKKQKKAKAKKEERDESAPREEVDAVKWFILVMLLLPETLTGLFIDDPAVVTAAASYLRIVSWAIVPMVPSRSSAVSSSMMPMISLKLAMLNG